jgi:hypothetical protein
MGLSRPHIATVRKRRRELAICSIGPLGQDVGLKLTGIHEHPWNARVFHLFGPEGNRLEVWQADDTGPAVAVDRL